MSFVRDQLRSLDLQFDRIQLERLSLDATTIFDSDHALDIRDHTGLTAPPTPRILKLQRIVQALSTTGSQRHSARTILQLLRSAEISSRRPSTYSPSGAQLSRQEYTSSLQHESDLEWVILTKASIQIYGLILNSLISQSLPLSNDLYYWDEVLSSYSYTVLYSLQTSPWRLYDFLKEVWDDALQRFEKLRFSRSTPTPSDMTVTNDNSLSTGSPSITRGSTQDTNSGTSPTKKFYALLRSTLREHSLLRLHLRTIISPFSLLRQSIRAKQSTLQKLHSLQSSALGVLVNESLSFESPEEIEDWKGVVERAIILMENVVRNVTNTDLQNAETFEDLVFSGPLPYDLPLDAIVESEEEGDIEDVINVSTARRTSYGTSRTASMERKSDILLPSVLCTKLQQLLSHHLPQQAEQHALLTAANGKPSVLVRYWIPGITLLLSSTTMLRYLLNRQDAIKHTIEETGAMIFSFIKNWVIEPVRKIIGTIRHDEDSEVALMSRESLISDKASLERMVVDFAIDNPSTSVSAFSPESPSSSEAVTAPSPQLTPEQIDVIRNKVKHGDLTAVLIHYERDLKSPIRGAITGELLRALLIQIQKTKVDVETAVSGIDSMLKSQQLLFGMLGLTPGVFICVGTVQWVRNFFGGRRGMKTGDIKTRVIRVLRNIDRILKNSLTVTRGFSGVGRDAVTVGGENLEGGMLTFKEHGCLLCEVHVLRELARKMLPNRVMKEFLEDVGELVEIRRGVRGQVEVAERIRWSYAKWIY